MKIKTVKEIKILIKQISFGAVLAAKLVRYDDKVEYEFILDTQFLYSKEITKDELNTLNQVLNILEDNKKIVLSRLKKYSM